MKGEKYYRIEYTCYDKSGGILKSGTVKAKRVVNGVAAQVAWERRLQTIFGDRYGRLVVHSCKEDAAGKLIEFIDQFGKTNGL